MAPVVPAAAKLVSGPLRTAWFIDRSVSMEGFRRSGEFTSFFTGLFGRLNKALRSDAGIAQSYWVFGRDLTKARSEVEWIKTPFNALEANLGIAFAQVSELAPDVAVVVSDGVPSDETAPDRVCPNTQYSVFSLGPSFKKLVEAGLGIWVVALELSYDGDYFLNCGLVDAATEAIVKEKYRAAIACPKGRECRFRYKGPKVVLAFVIAKTSAYAGAEAFVRDLVDTSANASATSLRLWPPDEPSFETTVKAARRVPTKPGTPEVAIEWRTAGSGTEREGEVSCGGGADPNTLIGLEWGVREVSRADAPAKVKALIERRAMLSCSQPADGNHAIDLKRAFEARIGDDFASEPRWLLAADAAKRFKSSRQSSCSARVFDFARGAAFPPEGDPCVGRTCERWFSFCGCLVNRGIEVHRAPAQVQANVKTLRATWRACSKLEAVSLSGTGMARMSSDKDYVTNPGPIFGLQALLERFAEWSLEAGYREVEIGSITLDVRL